MFSQARAGSLASFPAVSLPLEPGNLGEHTGEADRPPGSTGVLRPPATGAPGWSLQLEAGKGWGRLPSTWSLRVSAREGPGGDGEGLCWSRRVLSKRNVKDFTSRKRIKVYWVAFKIFHCTLG